MQRGDLWWGGTFWSGFGQVSVQRGDLWWVWDILEWVLGSECGAGGLVVGVWDSWGSECAAGGFVFWVWDSWGRECTAGGFVLVWDS